MKQNDRKLAAIMFTDIVGFSSLMTQNESEALVRLKQKDSLLKPLIQKYKGQFVKNMGDGSLSYFNSAIDAVECAKKLQQIIQKQSKITIRVGIHLGDIILENNDIYGDGVNVASRLESMAAPGSVLISKDIYDQISNHVEFDAVSLGLQALKGVGRLIEVYSVKGDLLNIPDIELYKDNTIDVHKKVDGTPSIAIIPFRNTGDKDDDFYNYGISTGIIQTCNQAGVIRVVSIENVKKIKNYDSLPPHALAKLLSVRYIITGSMLKVNDVFEVSIEVYDNDFSKVVWSDIFKENWHNLSKIKFKISEGILKTLDNDHLEYHSADPIDSRSYEYYLKGKYKYSKRQNSEDTEIARSMFKKSIKLDSKLIDAKLWLGTTYTETGNYNKAMQIFKEGIFVAEELKNERAKGMAYDCIGNIHWHKGKYDKSLENLYISLDIMNELNDQSGMAKSLHHIGHNYYYKGELDKALSYYNRSIEIIERLDDRHSMGHALLSLGNIYEAKNNIDKALNCYKQSYSISEMINDKYASGYAQMGIGNIYTKLEKFDSAIDCYERSLETRKEIDDMNGIAHLYHNLGVTYKKMYDFKNAIEFFELALELSKQLEDKYSSATTLKNIAEIYRIIGQYDKSLKTHFKSLNIRESIDHINGVVESLNCIGLVYYLMRDYENSIIYINKVNEIKYEDKEQSAVNKLYLALHAKEINQEVNEKEILAVFHEFDDKSYEIFYFLYKISNNSKFIKSAYEHLEKKLDTLQDKSHFRKYPIPSTILNIVTKN